MNFILRDMQYLPETEIRSVDTASVWTIPTSVPSFSPERLDPPSDIEQALAQGYGFACDITNTPIWPERPLPQVYIQDFVMDHGSNVARAEAIAIQLNRALQPADVPLEILFKIAHTHDLGKVPHGWLYDQGVKPSNPDLVKHVLLGEAILLEYQDVTGIQVNPAISHGLSRHHEALDGSGYPRGISSIGLSQSDRLLAIMDYMTARFEHRHYHERDYTMQEIFADAQHLAEEGKFDRYVLEKLKPHLDEFAQQMNYYVIHPSKPELVPWPTSVPNSSFMSHNK